MCAFCSYLSMVERLMEFSSVEKLHLAYSALHGKMPTSVLTTLPARDNTQNSSLQWVDEVINL